MQPVQSHRNFPQREQISSLTSNIKKAANIYSHLDTARKVNIAESLEAKFGDCGRCVVDTE